MGISIQICNICNRVQGIIGDGDNLWLDFHLGGSYWVHEQRHKTKTNGSPIVSHREL